jgi:hypothetical protein
MDNQSAPKGPWKVAMQYASWDENGDVVLTAKITLPQKSISLPEEQAVGEFITVASSMMGSECNG